MLLNPIFTDVSQDIARSGDQRTIMTVNNEGNATQLIAQFNDKTPLLAIKTDQAGLVTSLAVPFSAASQSDVGKLVVNALCLQKV